MSFLSWCIALVAILAAMLALATLWLVVRMQTQDEWVRHTLLVTNQIALVQTLVQRAETIQRGYLVTGRENYLSPYGDTEASLSRALDETARLVADNPQQVQAMPLLRQAVEEKLRELQDTIEEEKAGRHDAAVAIVNSDRGLQLMDRVHGIISRIRNEEGRLLAIRQSSSNTVSTLLQTAAATVFMLLCGIGLLVGAHTRRAFGELQAAHDRLTQRNHELVEKNRRLSEANDELTAVYDQGLFASHLNMEGRIVYANRAAVEDLGFAREDIIGKLFWEAGWWYMSETQEWIRRAFEQAAAGTPFRGELSYVFNEAGEERVTDIAFVPIKDEAGNVTSVFVPGTDVTDRAKQYRATFENAAVGIAHISPSGRWLRVNRTFAGIVGYRPDELITKSLQDIIFPDDSEASLAQFESIRDGRSDSFDIEKRYLRKDSAPVWVHATCSVVRRSDRTVDFFVVVVQDISGRKRAEELLRRQADLLDQSHDAILTWKIGGGIAYWNHGAETLYGYTSDEAVGRRSHDLLQTRAPICMQDIEREIARQGSWEGELIHTTRDGREIVVQSRHVRVEYDGEMYALETNRDITARKRAEEQIHLLMREANHRVKNLLGLVQIIARQTAAGNLEDFIGRFTERIQALAAQQDLLVRCERGTDVEDLVRAQLAHFADLVRSRIALDGPKLQLNAAAAQAIGLAIHELSTNAGKYGSLSTDAGRVDINWRVDGNLFEMNWVERNGPPVRTPDRRGFGSTVIETMAKRAVDGEVRLEYDPAGVAWQLTCPAANALERRVDEQK